MFHVDSEAANANWNACFSIVRFKLNGGCAKYAVRSIVVHPSSLLSYEETTAQLLTSYSEQPLNLNRTIVTNISNASKSN